ncbi:MAG: long-chain-fatty-acyl-CoA reductase [Selenomonas ruminantium]|nr:long-chain-fatty-acyl-CoA reductase [Selenomonas ruminantium]
MQQETQKIEYLIGSEKMLADMPLLPSLPIFSDLALSFLEGLSKRLLHSKEAKAYGDVVAYGFWVRRAYMGKVRKRYAGEAERRLGRGVAFHIAPSNIPVQFAVSLTYALLAGNASVVRVSGKEFPQVDIICETISTVIREECPDVAPYICVVRYGHDDLVTQKLSAICDIRMIWGGDRTIEAIRRAQVGPRCLDLGFADRYSLAVFDAEAYLEMDRATVAHAFYNDTYYVDQNACSSPRLIVWTGNRIAEAQEAFWGALAPLVAERYEMSDIAASEKLLHTTLCAAKHPGVREIKHDNLVVRLELPEIYADVMAYEGNCGYFLEYSTRDLQEILPLLRKKCQTITYLGTLAERLRAMVVEHGVRGVDRIVPVGRGMDMVFVWDGIDLPLALSRIVSDV